MNKIKLLRRLQAFFNADEKKRREQANEIKKVIKKLAIKRHHIQLMLEECQDPEMAQALQLEINIIKAQITKGNEALKQL